MNDPRLSRPALTALRAAAVVLALGFLSLVVANACARQAAYLPATNAERVSEPAPDLARPVPAVELPPPNSPVFFPATKAAPVWDPPSQAIPQQQAVPQQPRSK